MGPYIGMISMGWQFFSLYTFWNMMYATLSLDIWIDNFVKPFLLWLHDKHVAVKQSECWQKVSPQPLAV